MDQRRVIELVEQFRTERGQDTLAQLVGLIQAGCTNQDTLRQVGLSSMYWFANLVADDERETIVQFLEANDHTDAANLVRSKQC